MAIGTRPKIYWLNCEKEEKNTRKKIRDKNRFPQLAIPPDKSEKRLSVETDGKKVFLVEEEEEEEEAEIPWGEFCYFSQPQILCYGWSLCVCVT